MSDDLSEVSRILAVETLLILMMQARPKSERDTIIKALGLVREELEKISQENPEQIRAILNLHAKVVDGLSLMDAHLAQIGDAKSE